MKKLFLTSGIIACMACPAFATGGFTPDNVPQGYEGMDGGHSYTPAQSGTTTLAEQCVQGNLNTYSGSSVLEAQWVPMATTITYVAGTATSGNQTRSDAVQGDFSGSMSPVPVEYDGEYTAAANAFSTYGFHFVNWTADYNTSNDQNVNTNYNAGADLGLYNSTEDKYEYKATHNVTMTANWAPDTYTITYNCNPTEGGSGTAPTAQSGAFTATYGQQFVFAANVDDVNCHKDGYHFDHWDCGASVGDHATTNDPNTTRAYGNHPGDTVANWTYTGLTNGDTIACSAKYVANDIELSWTDSMDDTTYTGGATCTYNSGIELPTTPTKTGYVFTGWSATGTEDTKLDGIQNN